MIIAFLLGTAQGYDTKTPRAFFGFDLFLPGPVLAQARPKAAPAHDRVVRVGVQVVVWPAESLLVAHLMIHRYGRPEEVHADRLVWRSRWPWKRIVVSAGSRAKPLEQVVAYRVPADKLQDLGRFSRRLLVDQARGELSSLSDREDYNRLALNLADEVVRGRRTPEQARRFFVRTVRLSLAGKDGPYTKRLFIAPPLMYPPPSRLERF